MLAVSPIFFVAVNAVSPAKRYQSSKKVGGAESCKFLTECSKF